MKKRILSLVLVLAMSVGMMACGSKGELVDPTVAPTQAAGTENNNTETPNAGGDNTEAPAATATPVPAKKLEYAAGTVLRMATGYNSAKTGMFFDAETAGEGVTLADGKTYQAGDLKPTWVEVQNVLGVVFENKYQGNSAANEYKYWKEQLDQVDVVSGNATGLSEAGVAGEVINIAEYLDYMPNFKAYLEANPIVRLSITGDTDTGAIYFSPYFDGVNDIERMPLMRTDWVEKLLNGAGAFTASASNNLNAAAYTPYMPTSGKVAVDVVKKDGSAVESINKDYDAAGNIVKTMNDALAKGTVTGVDAVNMLRDYIDKAYNGYYGTNRADLFIGQNAAWDADELVALLRCVVANPQTLNGTDVVNGLFSREDDNTQRRVDMFRFTGTLFGVRGLESRQDYLYVGTDGELHDARQDEATYVALEKMNAMVKEGLIDPVSFTQDAATYKQLMNTAGDQLVGCLAYISPSFVAADHPSKQEWVLLEPLTGPEGVSSTGYSPDLPTNKAYITADCEHPEVAFRILDLMCREDFTITARWGKQGENWDYVADIKDAPQFADMDFSNTWLGYPAYFYEYNSIWNQPNNVHWMNDNVAFRTAEVAAGWYACTLDPEKNAANWELSLKLEAYEAAKPAEPITQIKYESADKQAESDLMAEELKAYVYEKLANWCLGTADVEAEWDTYLKELEAIGLSDWLEIQQAGWK